MDGRCQTRLRLGKQGTGERLIHVCPRAQAYGYGGAGVIINCLTDNTNRAKTEINNAIKKSDVSAGKQAVLPSLDDAAAWGQGDGKPLRGCLWA